MIAATPHHRPRIGTQSELQELIAAMPAAQVDPRVKAFREKRRKAHRRARTQRAINRKRAA
jgi:hypothetical protein